MGVHKFPLVTSLNIKNQSFHIIHYIEYQPAVRTLLYLHCEKFIFVYHWRTDETGNQSTGLHSAHTKAVSW